MKKFYRPCEKISVNSTTVIKNDIVERLEKQYQELHYMTERLKAARDFESLKEESKYYVNLSGAEKELGKVNKKKTCLLYTSPSPRD